MNTGNHNEGNGNEGNGNEGNDMVRSEDLAAAVRRLGRTLHAHEAPDEARAEAMAHLRSALELLDQGEPRLRWYEVEQEAQHTRSRNRELSTFSGALNSVAPPMRVSDGVLADGRAALIGRVTLDRQREGPPHSAHGGVLAGLFDELLGGGQRLNGGPPGVTGKLVVRYRQPTPLNALLELRVWIHDERSRRVSVRGECVVCAPGDDTPGLATGRVTADAEAFFLRVDFAQLQDKMRARD